jgi:hypothetical protein
MRWTLALVLALSACTRDEVTDVVQGRDTTVAGVPTVVFPRLPDHDGPLRLAERASLQLGGTNDNDSLEFSTRTPFLPVAELPDGRIVVGDQKRLKYFDASGKLLQIAGRAGSGPGEFSDIRDLCPQSDGTLAVIDDDGQWSLWNAQGAFELQPAWQGRVPYRGCSTNGDMLVWNGATESVDALGRRTVSYALHRLDGTQRLPLGWMIGAEYKIGVEFAPSFSFWNGTMLMADARTFALRELSLTDGHAMRSWDLSAGLRAMSQAQYDSIVAITIPRNVSATTRTQRLDRARELGKPDAFPAFSHVRRDPAGRIWIIRRSTSSTGMSSTRTARGSRA